MVGVLGVTQHLMVGVLGVTTAPYGGCTRGNHHFMVGVLGGVTTASYGGCTRGNHSTLWCVLGVTMCSTLWWVYHSSLVPRPTLAAADGLHHRYARNGSGKQSNKSRSRHFRANSDVMGVRLINGVS